MLRIVKSCSNGSLADLDGSSSSGSGTAQTDASENNAPPASPARAPSPRTRVISAAKQLTRDLQSGVEQLLNVGPTLAVVGIVGVVFGLASVSWREMGRGR